MCAFCPADAVEHGGEHIWDNWINKALPATRYRARRRYSLNSTIIEFDANSLNEKLPAVCPQCNSGWMSALSLKVKDRFGRSILEGEPFSLGARDAVILAAFTFLKAVVTNYIIDYEPFFTRAARERFRGDLTIPPVTKMWFAAFRGRSRLSAKNDNGIIDPGWQNSPFDGLEFCSYSYAIGQLVVQLFAPRWKHISDRGKPLLSLTPHAHWEQAATLFWPYNGDHLSWPPSKYFGDDTIQSFIERFTRNVNL
jgi:hypothetical protein